MRRIYSFVLAVTLCSLFTPLILQAQSQEVPDGFKKIGSPCKEAAENTVPFEKILRKAEAGNPEAQFAVAQLYMGCRDYETAIKWYIKAASSGNSAAQFRIGKMYSKGEGVPKDNKKAIDWISKAAAQDNPMAQVELGWIYYNGEGVPKDYIKAYKWFNLAAAHVPPDWWYSDPAGTRDKLAYQMTPAQIAEAQRLSGEFKAKNQGHRAQKAQSQAKPAIRGTGTGFFITNDGFLLTAYHVVKGADSVQVWIPGGVVPAKVIRIDTANDMALLKVEGFKCEGLAVQSSRDVKVGEEVFTIGFPNVQFQGVEAKYSNGHINSLSGFADDPRLFQISVPIQPGNSGGPLLRADGCVVGMVVAKLDELAIAKQTGSFPQNVNYALKSSLILSFLESLPEMSGKLITIRKQDLRREEIIEKSIGTVAMVVCY